MVKEFMERKPCVATAGSKALKKEMECSPSLYFQLPICTVARDKKMMMTILIFNLSMTNHK